MLNFISKAYSRKPHKCAELCCPTLPRLLSTTRSLVASSPAHVDNMEARAPPGVGHHPGITMKPRPWGRAALVKPGVPPTQGNRTGCDQPGLPHPGLGVCAHAHCKGPGWILVGLHEKQARGQTWEASAESASGASDSIAQQQGALAPTSAVMSGADG